uniref:Ribosomal RNA processing 7 homolog A n=1 Tax=Macaca fascicularis TaxID=9541 RepID=A0A7N9CSR2_MACFA
KIKKRKSRNIDLHIIPAKQVGGHGAHRLLAWADVAVALSPSGALDPWQCHPWWREAFGCPCRCSHLTSLSLRQESLSRLLSSCGLVQSVELQEKPDLAESPKESRSKFFHPKPVPGFQVAYVVFQKPSGVSAALALKGPLLVSTESHPVKSGIHKWISDYADSVPDPEALRVEVDTFMEAYDQKIAEEEAKAKEEEGVPDEEGWVKVTRRGRRPVLPRTEAASLRVLERERRKRARKELLNFYAWQHRESKMERKPRPAHPQAPRPWPQPWMRPLARAPDSGH